MKYFHRPGFILSKGSENLIMHSMFYVELYHVTLCLDNLSEIKFAFGSTFQVPTSLPLVRRQCFHRFARSLLYSKVGAVFGDEIDDFMVYNER